MSAARPRARRSRRRRAGALVVVVALALIVVAVIAPHHSRHVPPVVLDWQAGNNSSFDNLECPHPETQFAIVTSPVRQGRYAARFSESARDVWMNGTVRCLAASYDTAATTGEEHYFGFSMYIPRDGLTDNLVWELHQPRQLYTLPDCGVAPFAVVVSHGAVALRLFTGNCTVDRGLAVERAMVFPNLKPYPRGKWIDIVLHIRFEEASTGLVEAWSRTAGDAWPDRPQISLVALPTMPFCSSCGIFNVGLYTELGLYPGYAGYHEHDTLYIDGTRRGQTFADVAPPG